MRGLRAPAAAGLAAALLGASALMGCGAARPAHPGAATADRTKPATAVPASPATAPGAGQATGRLTAIAFTSPAQGYGMFSGQGPRRCPILAGPTHDGGTRFAPLVTVSTYPCGGYPPATWMAADSHGDAFLYYPALFVTHDGGRRWTARHEPGPVLAVATIGRSVWIVYADCRRAVRAAAHGCVLNVLESADGGRTWAPSPAQPPAATAHSVGGTVVTGGADSQTWLLRTGPSSAYLLSSPGRNGIAPLWYTGNGGASWAQRQIPCGLALSITLSAAPDGTLMAVCANQPSAGQQMKRHNELPTIWSTTDGGLHWSRVTVSFPRPTG